MSTIYRMSQTWFPLPVLNFGNHRPKQPCIHIRILLSNNPEGHKLKSQGVYVVVEWRRNPFMDPQYIVLKSPDLDFSLFLANCLSHCWLHLRFKCISDLKVICAQFWGHICRSHLVPQKCQSKLTTALFLNPLWMEHPPMRPGDRQKCQGGKRGQTGAEGG